MNKTEYADKMLNSENKSGTTYDKYVVEESYDAGQKDILVKVTKLVRVADQIANMSNTNISVSVMHDLQTALSELKNGF